MQKFNFGLCDYYYYYFIREHKYIRAKTHIRARDVDLIHTTEFINWFEEYVSTFTT